MLRNRRDGDAFGAARVERAQMPEQMSGGLGQVAALAEVEGRPRRSKPRRLERSEEKHGVSRRDPIDVEPDLRAWCVMRREHAWRPRGAGLARRPEELAPERRLKRLA